ncbi:MAG: peptidase U32 family protein, partial [Oscillospiraceae bacterium]
MPLELLSPAGSRERLDAAIMYGADAVYLASTEYGMRTAASNFSYDELKEATDKAHANNVKVYLTVNTLPRPQEADGIKDFLINAAKIGLDAFIIADIGVMDLCTQVAPEVEIHASTQMGIVNHLTATTLYKMGAKRVVLARELTFDEIRRIRDKIPEDLELEAFVHGAMCMSVSGRCAISNYLSGRDANRGSCTQPCRWSY